MDEPTARVSRLIHAQSREIWTALTTPSRIKAFLFGADTETTWAVGSSIKFSGVTNGRVYEDIGEILAFEPDEQLAYTHWSSLSGVPHTPEHENIVRFDLAADAEGTVVTITQRPRTEGAPPPGPDAREHAARTWKAVLDGLAANVEAPPGVPYVELGGRG